MQCNDDNDPNKNGKKSALIFLYCNYRLPLKSFKMFSTNPDHQNNFHCETKILKYVSQNRERKPSVKSGIINVTDPENEDTPHQYGEN